MLDRMFVGGTADVVRDTLAAAGRDPIAVAGSVRLARALAERGLWIVAVANAARSLRRGPSLTWRLCADIEALPLADGAVAAAVIADLPEAGLADLTRVVRPGGAVVLVDRCSPEAQSRRALCAGLGSLEQRVSGRTVITVGRAVQL